MSGGPVSGAAEAGVPGPLLGALLLVTSLALVPAGVLALRRLHPSAPARRVGWGLGHAALAGLSFLAALLLVGGLLPLPEGGGDGLDLLLRSVLVFAAVGLVVVSIARRSEAAPARALGLEASGVLRGALAGAVPYLVLLPVLFGLSLVWSYAVDLVGELQPQAVLEVLLALEGMTLLAALVLAVLAAPFLEELLFRGFLQPLLIQRLGAAGGVAATSLFFAALHGLSAFGVVFGLSLLLGALALRTGRLWAPFTAHALHNGLVLAVLLAVPGAREVLAPA